MAAEPKEIQTGRTHDFIDRKIEELTLAFNAEHVYGKYDIRISDDEMEAWLITTPPRSGKLEIDMNVINTLIKDNGIEYGLVENIEEIIPRDMKAETLLARGRMPSPGKDAQLRLLYEETGDGASPANPEDAAGSTAGNVDHRQIRKLSIAAPGEPIAMRVPPEEPVAGITVKGRRIPAAGGKDVSLAPGRNVELSEDGNYLISTAEGMVVRKGNMFEVVSVYLVDGDVDYSVGNIDFGGCVMVKGNVLPGFKVTATESIEIEGTVERATLEAGKDIRIHKSCYGDESCSVRAGDEVYARSLENARVRAGDKVSAEQYIVNSEITAGGDVTVLHPTKGRISGGHVRAGGNVISRNIGSPSYAGTLIEIGLPDFTRQDRNDKFNMINFYLERLKSADSQIRRYLNVRKIRKLEPAQKEKLAQLKEKATRHKKALDDLVARYGMPEILVKTPTFSNEVRISGTAYAGVRVRSNKSILIFSEDYEEVLVKKRGDELVMATLDGEEQELKTAV